MTLAGLTVAALGASSLVHRAPATPPDAGRLPASGAATAPDETGVRMVTGDARPGRVHPSAEPSGHQVPVHSAGLASVLRDRVPAPTPVAVTIASIGLSAPVIPVGVESPIGTVDVPRDVRTVGWYRFGSGPGQPGSTVLLGHVDNRTQGLGAFFRLRELRPGDPIRVDTERGEPVTYRVAAVRAYAKDSLPPLMFRRTGRPQLVLVTCGGAFDEGTGHYRANVVVYAAPTESR